MKYEYVTLMKLY